MHFERNQFWPPAGFYNLGVRKFTLLNFLRRMINKLRSLTRAIFTAEKFRNIMIASSARSIARAAVDAG